MILWKVLVIALVMYVVGVIVGRRWEKHHMLSGVVGYILAVDKNSGDLESVTYYFIQEAYDKKLKDSKEHGGEYREL